MTDAEAQQFLLTLLRSTGLGSYRAGDLLYASGPSTLSKLAAPTTTAMLLHGGEQPTWSEVSMTDDVTGVLAAEHGGTGLSSYVVGDLLYASSASALAKLADVAAGSFLRSGGVATAPAWSTVTIPNAAALGDLWYGSAANAISALAGQTTTTRKFLRQAGDGTHSSAPAWDTLLAADVTDLSAALALKLDVTAYTAASVLAKLITVDGAGSGLDADLLDGLSSAAFLQSSTYQALTPAWSAQHTFSANSGALVLANTGGPILRLSDTDAALDTKHVRIRVINGALSISSEDDALASVTTLLATSRTGAAWTNLALGNTTDNPTYSFLGTGTATFSGQATALRFVPTSSTIPTNGLFLPGANNPGLAANGTKVIDWTSTGASITGDLKLSTAGNGIYLKEGTNATQGVVTLVAGTATVSTTKVTASSRIHLTIQSLGTVAIPQAIGVTARVAGTSFTITSATITDTSVIAWTIIEPA